jgi:hypothetical protein
LGNGSPVAPGDGAPLRNWSGLPVRVSGLTRWRALTPCILRMNDIPSRVSLGAWLNRSLKAPQNILELLLYDYKPGCERGIRVLVHGDGRARPPFLQANLGIFHTPYRQHSWSRPPPMD